MTEAIWPYFPHIIGGICFTAWVFFAWQTHVLMRHQLDKLERKNRLHCETGDE